MRTVTMHAITYPEGEAPPVLGNLIYDDPRMAGMPTVNGAATNPIDRIRIHVSRRPALWYDWNDSGEGSAALLLAVMVRVMMVMMMVVLMM